MCKHETKHCPRCAGTFECKAGNITQCQCYSITFSDKEKDHIQNTYSDCLCRNCLNSMKYEARYAPVRNKIQKLLSIFKKE